MGLADIREQEGDHWVTPDDALQRHSIVAQAWAEDAASNPHSMQAITDDIDPAYIEEENDTSQGDCARAYMQVEREAEYEERMNYVPPTYDDLEDESNVSANGA